MKCSEYLRVKPCDIQETSWGDNDFKNSHLQIHPCKQFKNVLYTFYVSSYTIGKEIGSKHSFTCLICVLWRAAHEAKVWSHVSHKNKHVWGGNILNRKVLQGEWPTIMVANYESCSNLDVFIVITLLNIVRVFLHHQVDIVAWS